MWVDLARWYFKGKVWHLQLLCDISKFSIMHAITSTNHLLTPLCNDCCWLSSPVKELVVCVMQAPGVTILQMLWNWRLFQLAKRTWLLEVWQWINQDQWVTFSGWSHVSSSNTANLRNEGMSTQHLPELMAIKMVHVYVTFRHFCEYICNRMLFNSIFQA